MTRESRRRALDVIYAHVALGVDALALASMLLGTHLVELSWADFSKLTRKPGQRVSWVKRVYDAVSSEFVFDFRDVSGLKVEAGLRFTRVVRALVGAKRSPKSIETRVLVPTR